MVKMLVTINGEKIELSNEEFEQFCDKMRKAGYYPVSVEYLGLDSKFSDDVTIVGNNRVWKDGK